MRVSEAFRQSVVIALFAVCILITFSVLYVEARQETLEEGKELKGIPFDEFWSIIQDEGKKWAGDKLLYIAKISSGTFRRFDKHNGLSPVWEAQMVKCNEITERNEYGKTITKARQSEDSEPRRERDYRLEAGLHLKNEAFYGAAVDFERIKYSAQSAEQLANQHMRIVLRL